MRLASLALVLGLLVGFCAHSFVVSHPQWYSVFASSSAPAPKLVHPSQVEAAAPRTYPPPAKTLARLKKEFDDAVVVVLADESYDDRHQLVRVSVVDVWKGPVTLVGKTMDSRLGPPLSYFHATGKERVLKFLPMTPHLDSAQTVHFDGEALRMNPVLTLSLLKDALVEVPHPEANQSLEPTPTAGTSAAEPPRVPAAVVAHL